MTEAARVPPTPPEGPWKVAKIDVGAPFEQSWRVGKRRPGREGGVLESCCELSTEAEAIAVRDALNGVSEGASPTLQDQVGGVPSPSAIDRLPEDAITQVVRAYEDAEWDGADCDAAFRDALLSLAPPETPRAGGEAPQ